MIFHQLVDVWDLRQLDQLSGGHPHQAPLHPRMTGCHSRSRWRVSPAGYHNCHVDLALNPCSSGGQPFTLAGNSLGQKQGAISSKPMFFGLEPNSVSQTPLTVQVVPSSEFGHLLRMPEGPLGQQQLPSHRGHPAQEEVLESLWSKMNGKEGTATAVTGRREGVWALTSSWMSSLRSTLLSCPMRRKEEGVS